MEPLLLALAYHSEVDHRRLHLVRWFSLEQLLSVQRVKQNVA
jgi:hypothetical protein